MKERYIKSILEIIKTLVVSLVISFLILAILQPTWVSGSSMSPNLEDGDYLMVSKLAYKDKLPNRGDIIVFKTDLEDFDNGGTKNLIKRVIGLPGERVEVVNGYVYINGKKLDEPYLDGVFTDGELNEVVPENSLFVLGDNRPNSGDSRSEEIGMVSMDTVVGKAFIRLYPFNSIGILDNM